MSQDSAFRPAGNTVLVVASSSTASTPTQWSSGGMSQCWIANQSTLPVFIAWGTSSVQATVPTTGTPSQGLCLPSTYSKVFSIGPSPTNAGWISAATTGGTANIYVTPGVGF